MDKAPCMNCETRTIKCHSVCERYISWKKEKDALNEKRIIESHYKYPPLYMGNYEFHRKIRKDKDRKR